MGESMDKAIKELIIIVQRLELKLDKHIMELQRVDSKTQDLDRRVTILENKKVFKLDYKTILALSVAFMLIVATITSI